MEYFRNDAGVIVKGGGFGEDFSAEKQVDWENHDAERAFLFSVENSTLSENLVEQKLLTRCMCVLFSKHAKLIACLDDLFESLRNIQETAVFI